MVAEDVLGRNLGRTISGICLLLNLTNPTNCDFLRYRPRRAIGQPLTAAFRDPYSSWTVNDRNANVRADVTATTIDTGCGRFPGSCAVCYNRSDE
jgi:hypothetical protein